MYTVAWNNICTIDLSEGFAGNSLEDSSEYVAGGSINNESQSCPLSGSVIYFASLESLSFHFYSNKSFNLFHCRYYVWKYPR